MYFGFLERVWIIWRLNHDNRGAPYTDFPESGWDKLMALNVKAIFYSELSRYITLHYMRLC